MVNGRVRPEGSQNEHDILTGTSSDPEVLRLMPPLEGEVLAHMEREYRLRLASLQGIDDMVERIVAATDLPGSPDVCAGELPRRRRRQPPPLALRCAQVQGRGRPASRRLNCWNAWLSFCRPRNWAGV